MQAQRRAASRASGRATHAALWVPVLVSVLGYIALALVVLTSNASARSRGAAITVKFVQTEGVVQASSIAGYTARCPAAAPHAVGMEFAPVAATDDGQIAVAGSYPSGANGWTVVVKNLGGQPRGYFVAVVCVGAARARFATVQTASIAAAQSEGFGLVTCPRFAHFPLGGTFRLQAGAAPGSAVVDQTFAGSHRKGGLNGDQLDGMRNLTDTPVGIIVGAVCTSLPLHDSLSSSTAPAGKPDGFSMPCPKRGEAAIGGEFFATKGNDQGAIVLDAFFARNRGSWLVAVNNLTSRPVPYLAGVLCVG